MVMKKALILLPFILYYSLSYGQSNWYVGPSASTGMFWLYNKDDYKGYPYSNGILIAENNSFFSVKNFEAGFSIGKNITWRWRFESILKYSKYYQNYVLTDVPYSKVMNKDVSLKYVGFDITPGYTITNEKNPFRVVLLAGFRYNYLIDYLRHTSNILYRDKADREFNFQGYEFGNGLITNYFMDTLSFEGKHTGRYRNHLFGFITKISNEIKISESVDFLINFNASYFLTNTDNLKAEQTSTTGGYISMWSEFPNGPYRSKSHNIYCGLGLSLVYKFGDKY